MDTDDDEDECIEVVEQFNCRLYDLKESSENESDSEWTYIRRNAKVGVANRHSGDVSTASSPLQSEDLSDFEGVTLDDGAYESGNDDDAHEECNSTGNLNAHCDDSIKQNGETEKPILEPDEMLYRYGTDSICETILTTGDNVTTDEPTVDKVLKVATGQFQCSCGKIYNNRSKVVEHERRHRGIKPFKCGLAGCAMAFVNSKELLYHHFTHMGFKRYVCPYPGCDKRFTQSHSLTDHMKIHQGIEKFECRFCRKKFVRKSQEKLHFLRIHTDIRPFECTWKDCKEKFVTNMEKKKHIQWHARNQLP